MTSSGQLRLGRAQGYSRRIRLRKRPEIVGVQRRGRRLRTPYGTLAALPNSLGHPRFGFAVSRKVGNAVVRNRVKRRLREVYRRVRPSVGAFDVMFLANQHAAAASYVELTEAVTQALGALRPRHGDTA